MAKKVASKAIGLTEAKRLVSDKYEDERKGLSEGPIADKYRQALVTSPVTMAAALYHFAAKNAPPRMTRT